MKSNTFLFHRGAVFAGALVLLNALLLHPASARGDAAAPVATTDSSVVTPDDDADKAWKETRKALQPPMPPAEWQANAPTQSQVDKFYTTALLNGADKAKDFYTRFPHSPRAKDAKKAEVNLLTIAAGQYHDTTHADRLAALEKEGMNDPSASEDDKVRLRDAGLHRLANGLPATQDEFAKSARAFFKDYPKRDESAQAMLFLLQRSEGDQAKAVAQEIIDSEAPDQIKDMAKGTLKKMDALGKPLDIQFTAVDGRDVDVSKMKGKVVLVDFWATWCGPCMGELPHVKEAYEKLHDKGFEIVGISFDQDKGALQSTLKEKEMTWAQYFDGAGWGNKFGKQYGINSIPTMWLVDKKGNLRDMEARGALEEKVTKLLAE